MSNAKTAAPLSILQGRTHFFQPLYSVQLATAIDSFAKKLPDYVRLEGNMRLLADAANHDQITLKSLKGCETPSKDGLQHLEIEILIDQDTLLSLSFDRHTDSFSHIVRSSNWAASFDGEPDNAGDIDVPFSLKEEMYGVIMECFMHSYLDIHNID